RSCPVAVLGHRHAAGRGDDRRKRRDVEGAEPVAAGPDHVEEVARDRHRRGVGARGPGHAGDLLDRLTLHAEGHDEAGDLGGRGVAGHDRLHGRAGLLLGEGLAPDELPYGLDHPASSRKLRSNSRPSGVSTDSGWNWTPKLGRSRWRSPITIPLSVQAETSSPAGMEALSTTSEW